MTKKRIVELTIGNSTQDSDWLKLIRNGKYRKQDLKAHENASKKRKKTDESV